MKTISVNILENSIDYNISISFGFIKDKLIEFENSGAFFIIDENISRLYKNILPKKNLYIYKASEENKSISYLEKILEFLLNNNALRDDMIVAIGGGITGDISAFVASIYMRGIKLIQVPTTLLAMVDSSVGGKTAVNFMGIKNNIGTFYQPKEVLIDVDFLNSLSDSEFLNGLIEAIKIASVRDRDFFNYIKENKDNIIARNKEVMINVVSTSCRLKAEIVEEDEKEAGVRKLLNFGHTIAHGIEKDSNYKINHGFAVAIGIIYELQYALNHKHINKGVYNEIYELLSSFNYPLTYTPNNKDIMMNAISKDKKAGKGGISLAISGNNMDGMIIKGVSAKELLDLFQ